MPPSVLTRRAQQILAVLREEAAAAGSATFVCGQKTLASRLKEETGEKGSVRTVKRALKDLEDGGYITRRRRGDGAESLITLRLGSSPIRPLPAHLKAEGSDSGPSEAPAGLFRGDRHALEVATSIVTKLRGRPNDYAALAAEYLEYAAGAEVARIGELLDDFGSLPPGVRPTGDPLLDDGLRQHFDVIARRRQRNRIMRNRLGIDAES